MSDKNPLAVEHSYYCSESNYFANRSDGGPIEYGSWSRFLDEFDRADIDLNMVFRWDWKRFDPQDYTEEDMPKDQRDTLQICMMHQRKGKYCSYLVRVTDADADDVQAFLKKHWEYLKSIWEPISSMGGAK